jgi:hypothetical protein
MPCAACNCSIVDVSAIATRQTRLPLALAVGGALVLMTGFTLALIGEVLGTGKSGSSSGLLVAGLVLMAVGLALGAGFAVTLLSRPVRSVAPGSRASRSAAAAGPMTQGPMTQGPMTQGPAPRGRAAQGQTAPPVRDYGTDHETPQQFGGPSGYDSVDSAEEWLGPLRAAGVQPLSSGVRQAVARHAQAPAGRDAIDYSDEGWQLDSAGVAVPARPQPARQPETPSYPEPPSYPARYPEPSYQAGPPQPPSSRPEAVPSQERPSQDERLAQEIHHPVRPMHAPRAPGQRLGDTGQFPAYADPGQLPAYQAEPDQPPGPAEPEYEKRGSRGRPRLSAQISRRRAKPPGTTPPAGPLRPR